MTGTVVVIGILVLALLGLTYNPLAQWSQCERDTEFDEFYESQQK